MKTRFYKILYKNKDVVYVGVTTKEITERFNQHIGAKGLTDNYSVIEFDCVEHPEFTTLETFYAERRKIVELEQKYIKEELEKGSKLLNISKGGEWGCTILEKLRKEEFIRKFGSYDKYKEYKKKIGAIRTWIGNWVTNKGSNKVKRWMTEWVYNRGRNEVKSWVRDWVTVRSRNKVKVWLRSWASSRSESRSKRWVKSWVYNRSKSQTKAWVRIWVLNRSSNAVKTWVKNWVYNRSKNEIKVWVRSWVKCRSENKIKVWVRSWVHVKSRNPIKLWLRHWVEHRK